MTDHNHPFVAFLVSVVRLFWETSNRVLARCHRQALPLQLIHKCLWGCITNPVTPEVWWEGLPRFSWDCLLAHWTPLGPRSSRMGFVQVTWGKEMWYCLCWAGRLCTLHPRKADLKREPSQPLLSSCSYSVEMNNLGDKSSDEKKNVLMMWPYFLLFV